MNMNIIKKALESFISRIWYEPSQLSDFFALILSPASALYQFIADNNKRKAMANCVDNLPIKIIVIGNITAGGTGKTPLLIALANQLASAGWKPGIISRGHGGFYLKGKAQATWVKPNSDPFWVGDEPVLIAQALPSMPVAVCPRRIEAVNRLVKETDCNIILSDDGLQHYALPRDIEIVLVDAARGFGNQKLLPAGPLREPIERLNSVNMVVFNGQPAPELQNLVDEHQRQSFPLSMTITGLRKLTSSLSGEALVASDMLHLNRYSVIHLVAGIGHPERFFNAVRLQLSNDENAPQIVEHAFPDHHRFTESDLVFEQQSSNEAIVMTAKDAVKCSGFNVAPNDTSNSKNTNTDNNTNNNNQLPLYAVDVSANIDSQMTATICAQLAN